MNEYILQFDIPMNNIFLVQIRNSFDKLITYIFNCLER